MKLDRDNLTDILSLEKVKTPTYDHSKVTQGIVHVGVGGFHRAHLALYIEKLLNKNQAMNWGICGVGLRDQDAGMHQVLSNQDYLYTLVELEKSSNTEIQVVGSIGDFILAKNNPKVLLDKLVSDETKIVSLTITEGGYAIDDSTGQFNPELPEIQHDLSNPETPQTIFGYITLALKHRRELGLKPFTVMSCDNLPHNGDVTKHVLLSYSRLVDADLSDWIADNVSFPNSMVDRITPATSDAHKAYLSEKTGIIDEWPVVCEPFTQWVVEDKFCNGRPPLELVGVEFTEDVAPYEAMKINLLNGSHLTMTFVGLLSGYEFAHQTMEDQNIRQFVRDFMDKDVTPRLATIDGVDFEVYKETLIKRFSNTEICDQLLRIASDASSKFPKFIVPTLNWLIDNNGSLDRIALVTAAWIKCLQKVNPGSAAKPYIDDPKDELLQSALVDKSTQIKSFLHIDEVFGSVIASSDDFIQLVEAQYNRINELGIEGALSSTNNS